MKITGLTRRVDSLGRIVIPKELRRMLHIKEGSPLEIYMDADETIVLKKYSQVGSLKNISQAYAQSLSKVTGATVCVADRDEIIAAAVILCAYAEQGDKLEIVEAGECSSRISGQTAWLETAKSTVKNYLLDYNSNKESLSLNVYFSSTES